MFMRPRSAAPLAAFVAASIALASANAQLTLLPAGPMLGTHAGNLVANGSFELPFGGPGTAQPLWATGTSGTPFALPPGWSSSGPAFNYASWGRDTGSPFRLRGSDILPDGGNALYFGNGQEASVDMPPTFQTDGEVTFPGAVNVTPSFGQPVLLWQSVPTDLNLAPSYLLSFWVSGEHSGFGGAGSGDGIFGLRVTNTAPGDPVRYFVVPSGGASAFGGSKRFEFMFTPINPSLPVTIEFTNWGHFNLFPWGFSGTTELVLDDVIVNTVPGPACAAMGACAAMVLIRRRR